MRSARDEPRIGSGLVMVALSGDRFPRVADASYSQNFTSGWRERTLFNGVIDAHFVCFLRMSNGKLCCRRADVIVSSIIDMMTDENHRCGRLIVHYAFSHAWNVPLAL